MNKALIIIPTYNERGNISSIVESIHSVDTTTDFDILIVDDNSPDGTGQIVDHLVETHPDIYCIHRSKKEGLGRAYIAGFNWGINNDYQWITQMDADGQHDPRYLQVIDTIIQEGEVDYIIGSRYIKGGGSKNWDKFRKLISRGGNLFSSIILGCPIRDFTGGFNTWRATVIQAIDPHSLDTRGFSFQIAMKYIAFKKGFKFLEFPIIFGDRIKGESKMSGDIFFEALLYVIKHRFKHLK